MKSKENRGIFKGVKVVRPLPDSVSGISIDSRTIKPGELFFAIRGDKFDGHEFIDNAVEAGAAGVVVERSWFTNGSGTLPDNLPVLVAVNSTVFLGEWANYHRKKLSKPVIAITGSNGKTSTKEMTSLVLSKIGSVHKTEGNLNNHFGVPLSIYAMRSDHDFGVIELGINQPGEMTYLCSIAEPDVGVITNVSTAHTQYFGDLSGVARAKGELFSHLKEDGIAVVNVDDEHIRSIVPDDIRTITYGLNAEADVRGEIIGLDGAGRPIIRINREDPIKLMVFGSAMASNALAAAAIGITYGVEMPDIADALVSFTGFPGRLQRMDAADRIIINDTYNANPASVILALEVLSNFSKPGKKIVVLGDMLELGKSSEMEHRLIGERVASGTFDSLLAFGLKSVYTVSEAGVHGMTNAEHFNDKFSLTERLLEISEPGDVILIKGSRGMAMEEVIGLIDGSKT